MSNRISSSVSRRTFLSYLGLTAGVAALGIYANNNRMLVAPGNASPRPQNAALAVLKAMEAYPLIALGEAHQLQEEHDFIVTLLHHPLLPDKINDIVVEFGNARYQDIADRFIMDGEPMAYAELCQIWRNTVVSGANPVWDAPVYERFFRTVRAINQTLPSSRRLRVLLGDPPIDWSKVQSREDWMGCALHRDSHFAGVVEQEVLRKGRRALLIAGTGHFLRGERTDGDPDQPIDKAPLNTCTLLEQRYPRALFAIDVLLFLPTDRGPESKLVSSWARPALAMLAGTWLGAETIATSGTRATTLAKRSDAVLYLGQGDQLTASRPNPALYKSGAYAQELRRRGNLLIKWGIQSPGDPLEQALQAAEKGRSYFA
ncbi:MAG TPA: hypothetical protein VGN34_10975 [Ktedonobacteraceae bacterium]